MYAHANKREPRIPAQPPGGQEEQQQRGCLEQQDAPAGPACIRHRR